MGTILKLTHFKPLLLTKRIPLALPVLINDTSRRTKHCAAKSGRSCSVHEPACGQGGSKFGTGIVVGIGVVVVGAGLLFMNWSKKSNSAPPPPPPPPEQESSASLNEDPCSFKVVGKKYNAECSFPVFDTHCNIMAEVLKTKPEIYEKYYSVQTPNGVGFDKCIQTGVDNPGQPNVPAIGCVAGDEESYEVFKDFFYEVIKLRHGGYDPATMQQPTELNPYKIRNGVLDERYVLSCRIRTGRSIRGLQLLPSLLRAERREVERVLIRAMSGLSEGLHGTYYPLSCMSEAQQEKLIKDHIMFSRIVRPELIATGMARGWPDSRGIFINDTRNFIVWVNEQDHSRIMSMESGGNMARTFERFCNGLRKIEEELNNSGWEYMYSNNLGYILQCPSDLGTGLRASVHVKLPNLSRDSRFDAILSALKLSQRGSRGGVDSRSTDGIIDISNVERMGKSEVQLVQLVIDGVQLLIEMEKRLERRVPIDALIPTNMRGGCGC